MITKLFRNLPRSAQQLALGTGAVVGTLAGLHVSADLGLVPQNWKPSPQVWVVASVVGVTGSAAIAYSFPQEGESVSLPESQSLTYTRRSQLTAAPTGVYQQLTAATVDHTLSFRPGSSEFAEAMRDSVSLLDHARQAFTQTEAQTQEEWRSLTEAPGAYTENQHLLTGEDDDLQDSYGPAENQYPALQPSTAPALADLGSEDSYEDDEIAGDAWAGQEEVESSNPKVMRLSVLQAAASGGDRSYVA